jgi:hypothetical protein
MCLKMQLSMTGGDSLLGEWKTVENAPIALLSWCREWARRVYYGVRFPAPKRKFRLLFFLRRGRSTHVQIPLFNHAA